MTSSKGLIFLGAPGSGKGTQAQVLSQNLGIPHISTGDMLREAIAHQTELGGQAKAYMDKGELVPDELILGLIKARLGETDAQGGWILDGFPRNVPQAQFLDQLLTEIEKNIQWVINLQVSDDVIIRRLLLRGRADDSEATIRHRLVVYGEKTAPLVDYFHRQGKLQVIDGDRRPEEISQELQNLVLA
jgi:adenylate kinase